MAGLTADKRVVRNDIKLAAKIITNLDGKWGLWKPEAEPEGSSTAVMGLASNNPLLANITDYLIEEASAEEEELLGKREGEEEEAGFYLFSSLLCESVFLKSFNVFNRRRRGCSAR